MGWKTDGAEICCVTFISSHLRARWLQTLRSIYCNECFWIQRISTEWRMICMYIYTYIYTCWTACIFSHKVSFFNGVYSLYRAHISIHSGLVTHMHKWIRPSLVCAMALHSVLGYYLNQYCLIGIEHLNTFESNQSKILQEMQLNVFEMIGPESVKRYKYMSATWIPQWETGRWNPAAFWWKWCQKHEQDSRGEALRNISVWGNVVSGKGKHRSWAMVSKVSRHRQND